MKWLARAPSNIALVKYMGKLDGSSNQPANPSLSMTLSSLCSMAEVRRVAPSGHGTPQITWIPESPDPSVVSVDLNSGQRAKLLAKCTATLVKAPDVLVRNGMVPCTDQGPFELRTGNSFPMGAGIASSASSQAAVTLALVGAVAGDSRQFLAQWECNLRLRTDVAELSREASGSSCRSFFGPWVKWDASGPRSSVQSVQLTSPNCMPVMMDSVIVVESRQKMVSSSEAHARVMSSPLWSGRAERARERVTQVEEALATGDLKRLAKVSWSEAWEMHSLFHTSNPPFTYWEPRTLEILRALEPLLHLEEPPIVTLDAGANIHVLTPLQGQVRWHKLLSDLAPGLEILEDRQGLGAQVTVVPR